MVYGRGREWLNPRSRVQVFRVKRVVRPCSRCGKPRENVARYCRECKARYTRAWRAAGRERLTDEHRRRDRCRSRAAYLKLIGVLVPEACVQCGSLEHLEMHHPDYDHPELVEWRCRRCHIAEPKDEILPDRAERRPLEVAW